MGISLPRALIYVTLTTPNCLSHVRKLVNAAIEGAKAKGATVTLYQLCVKVIPPWSFLDAHLIAFTSPEILSDEILAKLHAAPRDKESPVVKPDDLRYAISFIEFRCRNRTVTNLLSPRQYDGFIFACEQP